MTRLAAVFALALVLAAGGCAGRTESPQDDAAGTVRTFLAQCAHGHGQRVLDELVPAGREAYVRAGGVLDGCARVLGLARGTVPSPGDFEHAKVTLRSFDGSQAGAIVAIGGRRAVVELTYGGDFWRMSGPH